MGSILSLRSRRSIGELKFPKALFRHDLWSLLLFDGHAGQTLNVQDQSRQLPVKPTYSGTPTWGVSRYGRYLKCDNVDVGILPHLSPELVTADAWIQGWDEATIACLVRPQTGANMIWSDRLNNTGDLQGVARLTTFGDAWRLFKNDASTLVVITGGTHTVRRWSLVVFDTGALGTRLYVDGLLVDSDVSTAALATLASSTEVRLNLDFVSDGINDYQLFAVWKRQIGPIVNHGLRHLVRAA